VLVLVSSSGAGRRGGARREKDRAPHRWRKPRQRELVPLSLSTRGVKN
jgi:hypothetical protein